MSKFVRMILVALAVGAGAAGVLTIFANNGVHAEMTGWVGALTACPTNANACGVMRMDNHNKISYCYVSDAYSEKG